MTFQPPDGIGTGCLKGPTVCADVGKGQTHERVRDLLPAQVGMNIGVIDVYNLIMAKGEGDLGDQLSLRRTCKNPIGFMGIIHVKQLLSGKKEYKLWEVMNRIPGQAIFFASHERLSQKSRVLVSDTSMTQKPISYKH